MSILGKFESTASKHDKNTYDIIRKKFEKLGLPYSTFSETNDTDVLDDEAIAIECIYNNREIPKDVESRLLRTKKERIQNRHKNDDNKFINITDAKRFFPQLREKDKEIKNK